MDTQLFQHHLLKTLSFPQLNYLGNSTENNLSYMCGFVSRLLHGSTCLSLSQHHSGIVSFTACLETRQCKSSNFVLSSPNCFGYLLYNRSFTHLFMSLHKALSHTFLKRNLVIKYSIYGKIYHLNHFQVYISVVLSTLTMFSRTLSSCKSETRYPVNNSGQILGAYTFDYYLYLWYWTILGTSWKWNHAVFVFQ